MSLLEDLSRALASDEPRILTIDIETSPNVAYVWGLWDQNVGISQLIEPSRVLCVAAKWHGEKDVVYVDERAGRKKMVQRVWDLLDQADIVVGYNHEKFDIPHLHREFLLAGLLPPSPYQTIDLLKVNRRRFKFPSNRLGYVSEALGIGSKLETGGQALWRDVLAGDERAWARFQKYNIQDVRLTEELFDLLSPWIRLPHRGQWSGEMRSCYACGSTELVPMGVIYGKAVSYPKAQCSDCGAWNKVMKNGETRAA
jgi:DNA polymerase elongation subunit (family B)